MSKTLLLADDSVTIQKVVGISFANEDVRLLTVDNGDDAVVRAREAQPDLVLADVVMPGKNGYEVCAAIKSDPALRHIPVLLLTGTFEAFDAERAKLAGADGFVTKPFEAQMLVDRVNELLARAKPVAAVAPAPPAPAAVAERAALDLFDEETPRADVEREPEAQAVEADDLDFASGEEAFVFEAEDELAITARPAARSTGALEAATTLEDPLVESEAFENGGSPATHVLDDDELIELGSATHVREVETTSTIFEFESSELPPEPVESDAEASANASATTLVEEWEEPAEELGAFSVEGTELSEGPSELDLELAGALAEPAHDAPLEVPDHRVVDPGPASEFDVSSSDLGDPLAAPVAPRAAAPATAPEPLGRAAAPPGLREELTAQLEKIAWEAFGDLAETLVKQTVARVEAIAWEVIPQMAESLIREEIRKLKGEK